MRLTSFSITLLVIAILGCNTEPTPEMIEELASEGEKSLPKLYKIAARADLKPLFPTDWEFDPTVAAMSAIADMGPAGTPFLLDLLPLKGEKRQLFVFRIFLENLQDAHNPTKRLAGDDRALLALIYSAIVDTVGRVDKVILLDNYLVLHKKAKLRNDLDLSLIDMSLWCLENRGKLPEYILPKQWPKAIVLRTLVNQVENDPDYAANYSDLLDKTLKEVGVSREKVEQEQEKPTQAAVPLEEPSQALPARKGLPEELKVEINKQLEAMASDNYKEREEATSNLYRLLKESAGMQEAMIAYLEKRTRMIVDLEVQTRIERLLVRCLYPWKYFRPIRTIVLKSGDSELPPGIRHFTSAVSDFSFSSDGKLLAVALSREKTVKIFNVHTGECLKTLEGHRTFTPTVAFSPDDKLLASGSDDSTVKIWDPHTGKCLRTLKGHRTHVTDVAFSPDGRILVSASEDKTIRVWDTRNWKCLHVLKGHRGYVCSISFSPDSKLLASGGIEKNVRIWDLHSGKPLKSFEGHTDFVPEVKFSPDGKLLASGGADNTVRIWDLQSKKCRHVFEGHTSPVCALAFSPDNKAILSAGLDNTIRIWDHHNGKYIGSLSTGRLHANKIEFSPNEKLLVVAGADGKVTFWGAPQENNEADTQKRHSQFDKEHEKPHDNEQLPK